MKISLKWQFNELKQVGKDYSNIVEVKQYDECHSKFRDVEKENNDILNLLSVNKKDVIADLGAGTGAFAIQAARRCKKVYAIDVSKAMLEYAESKAKENGITNIMFCHGGFLTYLPQDAPVDIVASKIVLHHLPDFWKAAALQNIKGMLKSGGKFLLIDVIFSEENYLETITKWMVHMEVLGGRQLVEEIEMHVCEEYSTFSWIMEGLIKKAGFTIDNKEYQQGVLARYICTKN